MATEEAEVTTQKKPATKGSINFLVSQKTFDWRYRTAQDIRHYREVPDDTAVVFWTGILNLLLLPASDNTFTKVPLEFIDTTMPVVSLKTVKDGCEIREEDGKPVGTETTYQYDLSAFADEIQEARRDPDTHYLHFFIEERIDKYGSHEVNVIKNKKSDDNRFAIPTKMRWPEMPIKKFLSVLSVPHPDDDEWVRITVLTHRSYRWMK